MSRHEKLKERFEAIPADFTWNELCRLLKGCGFDEISGSGSRYKFYHKKTGKVLSLHKPHPGNIVKQYAIKQVLEHLKECGEIK